MLPYKTLIKIDKAGPTPVYRQIANALVSLIRGGTLKPGDTLPSTRELAEILGIHRKTAVAAYEELNAQDWIETIPRKGITVSGRLPETKPRSFKAQLKAPAYSGDSRFSFKPLTYFPPQQQDNSKRHLFVNDGFPDARLAPVKILLKEYETILGDAVSQGLGMGGPRAGSINLRNALVQFLSTSRGLTLAVQNILTCHGAQMAIYMAAALLVKPGATVIVGEPSYFMANIIFEQFGARLVKVAVDENGIDVDAIEKLCMKKKPALLYIIPHHHHPTTVTLSAERRMKLLQLVTAYNIPVIEDDYDYDFHYSSSPILPLAAADHGGNVIYIGSLTKCLAPNLRMGYMVAPANFIASAGQLRLLMDIRGDYLLEEAMARLFEEGHIQRHIKKSVKLYRQRRDALCELLQNELGEAVTCTKPAGGMAVWVKFDNKYSLPTIAGKALTMGVYMTDGHIYNTSTTDYNALRFGFASFNEQEMGEVVGVIKKLLI